MAALCDHGALINALDDDGVAPIHKAVIHSNTEVAEELIACGADANFPLHVSLKSISPLLYLVSVCEDLKMLRQHTQVSHNCTGTC